MALECFACGDLGLQEGFNSGACACVSVCVCILKSFPNNWDCVAMVTAVRDCEKAISRKS